MILNRGWAINKKLKREGLNIGTAPMFKMHNKGIVPTFKTHNVGTVSLFKMHSLGTVPTDKMHIFMIYQFKFELYGKNK